MGIRMERIATSKARKDFREVLKRVAAQGGKRVKITLYGKTLVALIPPKDLRFLEDCESRERQEGRPRRRPAKARRSGG